MMDENAAHEWLTWLYGDSFEGKIWIGGHADRWRGGLFTSIDAAVGYASWLDAKQGHGVYHRLTTMRDVDHGRGEAEDSVMLPALMADIDVHGPGHKAENLPRDFSDVQRILAVNNGVEPTTWINSGGGLYPVWRLAEPMLLADEESLKRAQEMSRKLHRNLIAAAKSLGMKVDNTSDLARVYRLPGTVNRKVEDAHRHAKWINVGVVPGGYVIEDVADGHPAETEPVMSSIISTETGEPQSSLWADLSPGPIDRSGQPRPWTLQQAMAHVNEGLAELRAAQDGEINNKLSAAACRFAHFGPEFWDREVAYRELEAALAETEYDGQTWKAADSIDSAFRTPRDEGDNWAATLIRLEPETAEEVQAQAAAAGEPDPVDALLAEMIGFEAVSRIPAPKYLIHGLLQFESESWIIGAPGSKKSFVALDMAARVARGEATWQGRDISPADVVMIVAEGAGGMGKRAAAFRKRFGEVHGIHVLPRPVQAAKRVLGVTAVSAEWQILALACERLADAAKEKGRGLFVIVDTQARVTVGLNENAAEDMGHYIEAIRLIKEKTKGCVLSVHHTGRSGGDARGSSAIDGAQTTEIKIESKPKSLTGRLIVEKQKDIEEIEPIRLGFEVIDIGQDDRGGAINSLVLADQDSVAFKQAWAESLDGDLGQRSEARLKDRERLDLWIEARRPPGGGQPPVNEWWIVQALVDTAETLGLTQSDVKNIVEEKRGALDKTTFKRAWQKVTDEAGVWTDVVIKAGGERWTVDRVQIAEIVGVEVGPENVD